MTVELSPFSQTVLSNKYLREEEKSWEDVAWRVAKSVVGPFYPDRVKDVAEAIINREFIPGGRQLANAGYFNMLNNCFLYRVGDSKEEIADFFRKGMTTGMTGGGVGAVWTNLRPRGASVNNQGKSTGPVSFMQGFNEVGRAVVNGGGRRMAIWAGLHWYHPDVFEFMAMKDWDERTTEAKAENYSAFAPMDMTNISIILDDEFFDLMHGRIESVTNHWYGNNGEVVAEFTADQDWAWRVYLTAVAKMLETGEPGFSVDLGDNRYENLRNPCCEITSEDDNDVCCLGSVNMAAIKDLDRMEEVTELGTLFLLCSTMVSEVPHEEVKETRTKNRRLGLGLMGIHEWLIARGYKYEPNDELEAWLVTWMVQSDNSARHYADDLQVSRPKKVRAIAPAGSIGIIGETTTGIEPIFAAAYKRRYIDNGIWKFQYVVDATFQRMVDKYGVDPKDIETAYDLAQDPERRLLFQAFVQQYTDHAISSTLNLPQFSEQSFTTDDFAKTLLSVLPDLRGITAYPDGARGGQPLNVVPYEEAAGLEGLIFDEVGLDQACVSGGVCGV